jgi:hypothetical protein
MPTCKVHSNHYFYNSLQLPTYSLRYAATCGIPPSPNTLTLKKYLFFYSSRALSVRHVVSSPRGDGGARQLALLEVKGPQWGDDEKYRTIGVQPVHG